MYWHQGGFSILLNNLNRLLQVSKSSCSMPNQWSSWSTWGSPACSWLLVSLGGKHSWPLGASLGGGYGGGREGHSAPGEVWGSMQGAENPSPCSWCWCWSPGSWWSSFIVEKSPGGKSWPRWQVQTFFRASRLLRICFFTSKAFLGNKFEKEEKTCHLWSNSLIFLDASTLNGLWHFYFAFFDKCNDYSVARNNFPSEPKSGRKCGFERKWLVLLANNQQYISIFGVFIFLYFIFWYFDWSY